MPKVRIPAGRRGLVIDGVAVTATSAEINKLAGLATTATELALLAGLIATAAQINAASAGTLGVVEIPDATTYTVLAANSGKDHVFPDLTATCTASLPALAAGLKFAFQGQGVAADAQNWVFTAATGAFLLGGVSFVDNDAGAGADEMHAGLYPNGSSHLTLTVVTPAAGTWVTFKANAAATRWIVNGWVNSATVPAFS